MAKEMELLLFLDLKVNSAAGMLNITEAGFATVESARTEMVITVRPNGF